MKLAIRHQVWSILPLVLMGCATHPAHFADGQQVAFFDGAGQVQADLGYQFEKGFQSQLAAAVSPQWALHLGGAYAQQDNCHSCSKEVTRHLELGFENFRKLENGYLLGLMVGAGLGRFKALGTDGAWDPAPEEIFVSSGKYSEFFLQGHYGRQGRIWEQAGSVRLSGFHYDDFHAWDGDQKELAYPEQHLGLFLEPAYTLRAGPKHMKVQFQSGISLPMYQAKGLSNSKVWLNMGFVLNTAPYLALDAMKR